MLEVQYSQARACFLFLFGELPCTPIACEWEMSGSIPRLEYFGLAAGKRFPTNEQSDTLYQKEVMG